MQSVVTILDILGFVDMNYLIYHCAYKKPGTALLTYLIIILSILYIRLGFGLIRGKTPTLDTSPDSVVFFYKASFEGIP